jgi:UDP-glucose 4-epimerase
MAGKKSVAESALKPDEYFSVNVDGTESILNAIAGSTVTELIFSSSASVYGNSKKEFVTEIETPNPLSNYGRNKLAAEELVRKRCLVLGIPFVNMRFFNVVGCITNELRDTSSENLFPIIANAIALQENPIIYGNDYPTPDGTCIRDFIHVQDIAEMHFLALKQMKDGKFPPTLNLGTGIGYSVLEVVTEFLSQTKSQLKPVIHPPRLGDPAKLIADVSLMKRVLNFQSKYALPDLVRALL